MDRDRRASLAVGVFVVASLSLLAAVILTLSSERGHAGVPRTADPDI